MSADDPYQPPQQPSVPPMQVPGSQETASALDAIIPTNPLAAVSCYSGIVSMILCPCGVILGPVALITGWLSFRTNPMRESTYGSTTSKVRSWIGIVTGAIGTVLGIIAVGMMIYGAATGEF